MIGSSAATTDGSYRCHYCGGYHDTLCPRVAEIEYFPTGLVKRVRFFGDDEAPQHATLLPTLPQNTWGTMVPPGGSLTIVTGGSGDVTSSSCKADPAVPVTFT